MLDNVQVEANGGRAGDDNLEGGLSCRSSASGVSFGHLNQLCGNDAVTRPKRSSEASSHAQALRHTATFTRLSQKQKCQRIVRERCSFKTPNKESLGAADLERLDNNQSLEESRESKLPNEPSRNHGMINRTALNSEPNSIFSDEPRPGAPVSQTRPPSPIRSSLDCSTVKDNEDVKQFIHFDIASWQRDSKKMNREFLRTANLSPKMTRMITNIRRSQKQSKQDPSEYCNSSEQRASTQLSIRDIANEPIDKQSSIKTTAKAHPAPLKRFFRRARGHAKRNIHTSFDTSAYVNS